MEIQVQHGYMEGNVEKILMLISNAVNTVDVFVMKTILQMDYLTQVKIVSLANKESSNFANYFQLCRISCISFILCDNFSNTI